MKTTWLATAMVLAALVAFAAGCKPAETPPAPAPAPDLTRIQTDVANKTIARTTPVLLTIDETFDIGSDTRTRVDDADYQVPFPFTGTINKVNFKLGPSQLP